MSFDSLQNNSISSQKSSFLQKCALIFSSQEFQYIKKAFTLSLQSVDFLHEKRILVAEILYSVHADSVTLQAALLMDIKESDRKDLFPSSVEKIIAGVAWLNTFDNFYRAIENPFHTELLRRMFLAEVGDVRAILVKLAYLLHHLRTCLKNKNDEIGIKIARETLDIFSPLVNRLGIGQLKWELEDLSFQLLQPKEYHKIANTLEESRSEREKIVFKILKKIQKVLEVHQISAEVYGRSKHIFSIFKKMQDQHKDLGDIYDLLAVRVIVESIDECYLVLGLVHGIWKHIPEEFCDYIAKPKKNGYQSLHTVVIGEFEKPVEIQIRTKEMHSFAECGIAAHWRYKEGVQYDTVLEKSIESLRKFLEEKNDEKESVEVFGDQIFVFTPKGQVVRLKKGSTPLDFAYSIHTELGHRCRGAKVNGQIVPLHYQLQSKETVEILTQKNGTPHLGWLDPSVKHTFNPHTRRKIRQWFANHAPKKGEEKKKEERDGKKESLPLLQKESYSSSPKLGLTSSVSIYGNSDLMMHFAQCCNPIPPTPILGYVTIGNGISIHAMDCKNISHFSPEKKDRCIAAEWQE